MSGQSDSSSDGPSSFEALDMVLYLFVLGPAVEWCLKSERVNKGRPGSRSGIALAVCLLGLVAAAKLAVELAGREPNHFETLGVRVDATVAEIRRAHRELSLAMHPDKSSDPNASSKFTAMQEAYDVLKDPSTREAYNKFGKASDDANGGGITSIAMFYVIWLVVGYLLTMGKASEDARTWAFSGLLALAVFEYQTRILSVDYLAPIFPRSTVHEKLEILHKIFPPFLHGGRMISQVIFRDMALYNKMLLEQMHLKLDQLGHLVHATRRELDAGNLPAAAALNASAATAAGALKGGLSTAASAGEGAAEADAQRARGGSDPTGGGDAVAVTREASQAWNELLRPPRAAPAAAASAGAEGAAAAKAAAEAQTANQTRVMNIVWFFVVYAGFKYLTENSQ